MIDLIGMTLVSKTLKNEFCQIMSEWFPREVCKNVPHAVKILEKISGYRENAPAALDPSKISKEKQNEKEWMLKLWTDAPYGLSNGLSHNFKKEEINALVGCKFLALPKKSTKVY